MFAPYQLQQSQLQELSSRAQLAGDFYTAKQMEQQHRKDHGAPPSQSDKGGPPPPHSMREATARDAALREASARDAALRDARSAPGGAVHQPHMVPMQTPQGIMYVAHPQQQV